MKMDGMTDRGAALKQGGKRMPRSRTRKEDVREKGKE